MAIKVCDFDEDDGPANPVQIVPPADAGPGTRPDYVEEMRYASDSGQTKPSATSRGTCDRCGEDLKWSMVGWVHNRNGSGLC